MTTAKHVRVVNDTILPLNAVITLNGNPVDLSQYTVKFQMEADQSGLVEIAETTSGVTSHPTQVFTASATTDLLTCNGHGVKEGDQIIVANSGGTLPTGLTAATRYYAVQVTPNAFSVATLPGGSPIDITGAGTGTNTFYIVGSVQYAFSAGGVDTVGLYRGWLTLYSGSSPATFPNDEYGIPIEIKALGN